MDSKNIKDIKRLIIETLKHNRPMSKNRLISSVAADLGNGEVQDELIGSIIERMADRMIILETGSGKLRLNE